MYGWFTGLTILKGDLKSSSAFAIADSDRTISPPLQCTSTTSQIDSALPCQDASTGILAVEGGHLRFPVVSLKFDAGFLMKFSAIALFWD